MASSFSPFVTQKRAIDSTALEGFDMSNKRSKEKEEQAIDPSLDNLTSIFDSRILDQSEAVMNPRLPLESSNFLIPESTTFESATDDSQSIQHFLSSSITATTDAVRASSVNYQSNDNSGKMVSFV